MEYLKNNLSKFILILLLVFAGLYMYIGNNDRSTHLNSDNVKYTTGEIIDFGWGAKSPPSFTFIFYVNDKKIKSYYSIVNELATTIDNETAKKQYIGKKYLVKYSTTKPKYNIMDLSKPIPDSLSKCIRCSWATPPF